MKCLNSVARHCVMILLVLPGCVDSPNDLGNQILDAALAPNIVGDSARAVLYVQTPEELLVTGLISAPGVSLVQVDLESGRSDTVARLLPHTASLKSNDQIAAWVNSADDGYSLEVMNLSSGQRDIVLESSNYPTIRLDGLQIAMHYTQGEQSILSVYDVTSGLETEFIRNRDIYAWQMDYHDGLIAFVEVEDGAERITVLDTETLAQTIVAEGLSVYSGPYIDTVYGKIVWSGGQELVGDLGTTQHVVSAYDLESTVIEDVVLLEEFGTSEFLGILDGQRSVRRSLEGVSLGAAVVVENKENLENNIATVELYDLVEPKAKEIGEFVVDLDIFLSEPQIKAFPAHVTWYNPDGNRIVVWDGQKKQKFKPTGG